MKKLQSLFSLELRRARALVKKIYTGIHPVEQLPNALQHFLLSSGFLKLGDLHQVKIEWATARLKFEQNGAWQDISVIQHNFLPDPIRLVYMKAKLFGLFGLAAFDGFRHGKGYMQVRLAKLFNLVNATGAKIDKSALVTLLAETMIIPTYALQTYIQWEEIDSYSVKGTINYHGLKASGIFYFNSNFEITKFETEDRYLTTKSGELQQTHWTASCEYYHKHGSIRYPTSIRATWNMAIGDYTYFEGRVKNLIINPN